MTKSKSFRIRWVESPDIDIVDGDGVEFHALSFPSGRTLIAFLRSYAWYKERPKVVTILIRKEGDGYSADFLMEARKQIEAFVKSRTLKPGQIAENLEARFNA